MTADAIFEVTCHYQEELYKLTLTAEHLVFTPLNAPEKEILVSLQNVIGIAPGDAVMFIWENRVLRPKLPAGKNSEFLEVLNHLSSMSAKKAS